MFPIVRRAVFSSSAVEHVSFRWMVNLQILNKQILFQCDRLDFLPSTARQFLKTTILQTRETYFSRFEEHFAGSLLLHKPCKLSIRRRMQNFSRMKLRFWSRIRDLRFLKPSDKDFRAIPIYLQPEKRLYCFICTVSLHQIEYWKIKIHVTGFSLSLIS